MLQIIADLPPYVVGARAMGQVDKTEFERVLAPAFQYVADTFGEMHFLLQFDSESCCFSWDEWWKDFRSSVDHFTRWKKIAIISDSKSIEQVSDVFTLLSPGSVKGFQTRELEEAKLWMNER